MTQDVKIKAFSNEKGQNRYLIVDIEENELHKAGGSGFKTVETAEAFAKSHQWTVVQKPTETVIESLITEPLF